MIVLNSPKGWTGPKEGDGEPVEGNFRSHQVPLHPADHPGHLKLLEDWLRSDHNGFTHQDPGFIDHVVNKRAEVVRVYLPPDANCVLSVMDHCLRSRHYIRAHGQDMPEIHNCRWQPAH